MSHLNHSAVSPASLKRLKVSLTSWSWIASDRPVNAHRSPFLGQTQGHSAVMPLPPPVTRRTSSEDQQKGRTGHCSTVTGRTWGTLPFPSRSKDTATNGSTLSPCMLRKPTTKVGLVKNNRQMAGIFRREQPTAIRLLPWMASGRRLLFPQRFGPHCRRCAGFSKSTSHLHSQFSHRWRKLRSG